MSNIIPASGGVFICYRREDSAFAASYLYDRLSEHFGSHRVFKDVDSVPLGDDFVHAITEAVASCDCLIAVIGPRWLAATDDRGRRRIDLQDDYVRLELEAALQRNTRVIPVCTDGARMPQPHELPPGLESLVRRNALEVTPTSIRSDIARLIAAVEAASQGPSAVAAAGQETSDPPRRSRRLVTTGLPLLVLVIVLGLAMWWMLPQPRQTHVTVLGTEAWTDTGVSVSAGERISVTATGQINTDVALTTGPEGFPNRPEWLTPLASANHGGLLARVADAAPVFIGGDGSFVADRDGDVELGINDGGLENNAGAFEVVVTTRGS